MSHSTSAFRCNRPNSEINCCHQWSTFLRFT